MVQEKCTELTYKDQERKLNGRVIFVTTFVRFDLFYSLLCQFC